jgi:hypothetical protein
MSPSMLEALIQAVREPWKAQLFMDTQRETETSLLIRRVMRMSVNSRRERRGERRKESRNRKAGFILLRLQA